LKSTTCSLFLLLAVLNICQRINQSPNRSTARAFAFAASSSRFFGGAVVSSERRSRFEIPATSSTAAKNASSFAFDGFVNPLIFRTNCSEAARTSSSVTGGSKLNNVLIFLHMEATSVFNYRFVASPTAQLCNKPVAT
jgi:hypothetical protein